MKRRITTAKLYVKRFYIMLKLSNPVLTILKKNNISDNSSIRINKKNLEL